MHRQVEPKPANYKIPQFPHCDQRVLHAPGECEYCDGHSDWQALRAAWGIAFTNYQPDGKELPCPAMYARGEASINSWGGNVARPKEKTS
jgi:hypothetical protein